MSKAADPQRYRRDWVAQHPAILEFASSKSCRYDSPTPRPCPAPPMNWTTELCNTLITTLCRQELGVAGQRQHR